VSLRIPSSSRSPDHDSHRTTNYLGHPVGRFAGLKHRQLARQVGVIITTGQIRRTNSRSIYSATLNRLRAVSKIQDHKSNLYLMDYYSTTYISMPSSKMHKNPKLISWHRSPKQQICVMIKTARLDFVAEKVPNAQTCRLIETDLISCSQFRIQVESCEQFEATLVLQASRSLKYTRSPEFHQEKRNYCLRSLRPENSIYSCYTH
jgi:hypothetical protein